MVCDDLEFEIVVQVVHVVGYEFQNDQIQLRFTLDGHRLETERIFAKTDKVHVNTNVSWTTKKRDIKRMKAENLPIKVECFRVRERNHLEAIGYVLIPLRIIPTCLYKNDEILPSPRWYKLMGVPSDMLHNKPEIHLNVIIQPEQECLSATHLRGQIDEDDEGDESYAEPDIIHHFEITRDVEMSKQEALETPPVIKVTEVEEIIPEKEKRIIIPIESNKTERHEKEELETQKYVQKLEDWKKEEKDNFMTHLKKVENTFLESMFEEWQRKKHEEENKLQNTIDECERLSKKLEEGYAQMKDVRRADEETQKLTMGQAVLQEEVALERKRNAALEMELREEREENKMLRNRIREMEQENVNMEQEIAEQIRQLEASMKKLKTSKDYYKQKWLQLIREVNKLSPNDE